MIRFIIIDETKMQTEDGKFQIEFYSNLAEMACVVTSRDGSKESPQFYSLKDAQQYIELESR